MTAIALAGPPEHVMEPGCAGVAVGRTGGVGVGVGVGEGVGSVDGDALGDGDGFALTDPVGPQAMKRSPATSAHAPVHLTSLERNEWGIVTRRLGVCWLRRGVSTKFVGHAQTCVPRLGFRSDNSADLRPSPL